MRVESVFEVWGRFVVRQRRIVVMLALLVTVALGGLIPQMRIDNSPESFLHPDDPAREVYDDFRRRFDRDDRTVIGLRPPEVFDSGFLRALAALHRDLEAAVPYVEEVTSLVNARSTYGRGDELVVEDLLEHWPETSEDLVRLRERVFDTPLYINSLISGDGRLVTLTLKPNTYSSLAQDSGLDGFGEVPDAEPVYLTEAEEIELVRALHQVLDRHHNAGFEIFAVGGPLMSVTLNQTMVRDANLFVLVTIGVMALILLLIFRRASGVLLPVIVVLSALMGTLGIMVLLDIPMSVVVQILPAFLLAVGICDSVHLMVIVYQRMSEGQAKHDAIVYALGHSGFAVLMTSLTTAGGLVSFTSAQLAPVANLGVVAPIGVMLAFFYSVTLLPALIAVSPIKASSRAERHAGGRVSERLLIAVGAFSTRNPRLVLAGTVCVLMLAALGVSQARFSHDAIRWFPAEDPLRIASETLNDALEGVASIEFLIDSGGENGLHDPQLMQAISHAMERAGEYEGGAIRVGGSVSIVNVVKETHRALNENRASHYAIPDDRELLAQELLLFENSGSDDLEALTTPQFSEARVTVRMPWVDAIVYPEFIAGLEAEFRRALGRMSAW